MTQHHLLICSRCQSRATKCSCAELTNTGAREGRAKNWQRTPVYTEAQVTRAVARATEDREVCQRVVEELTHHAPAPSERRAVPRVRTPGGRVV